LQSGQIRCIMSLMFFNLPDSPVQKFFLVVVTPQ
jgi:hypothetical protein